MIFQNNKRLTLAEEDETAREFKIIFFELFLDIVSTPPRIMSILSYDWSVIYQRGLNKRLALFPSSFFVLSKIYCITASFLAYVELQFFLISPSLGIELILVEICLKPLK